MNIHSKSLSFLIVFLSLLFFGLFAGQAWADVNPDGSLFHKFQIEVPQGINKIQPDLHISYNSSLPNGIVGAGWNIDGLPRISRVNSGNGIHFDGNDTYLGLQDLLVDISGNKSEYHTKNESFYRYKPVYGACNLSSTEPCGWIVNSPDGNTMYFGEDENGGDGNSRVLADNHPGYKMWSLRKVIDLHHNEYIVKYKIIQGVMYPDTIIYNTNGFRYRVVRFNYEDRNDTESKYINGGFEVTNKRLQSIEVASNAICVFGYCTSGDLIRKYKLDYKYSVSTYRSLLTQIQEFGTDGVISLPPISFMYSEPDMTKTDTSETLIADFKDSFTADINNDGLTDLVRYGDSGSEIKVGYQLSNGQTFLPITGVQSFALTGWKLSLADLNGDGQKDLVFSKGTSVMYSLWVNSTWSSTLSTANLGDAAAIGWTIIASDINMDGIDDLVYFYNYHDTSTPACPACARKVQIDIQLNSPVNSQAGFLGINTIYVDNTLNDEWFVMPANLNNDSTMDFILANYKNGVTINYLLSDGNHYQTIKNAYTHADIPENRWMAIPSDYNGDGKTDLIYFSQNYSNATGNSQMTIGYQLSNGNGFDGYVQYTTLSENGPHSLIPIDVNGDNKSDFLLRKYGSDYCDIHYSVILNKEDGQKTPQDYFSFTDNAGGTNCKMNFQAGDFNGDGIVDIVHTRFNGSAEDKVFYSFQTNYLVDKMTSMTNGYGSKISTEYKPLSFFTAAVKSDAGMYCGSLNFDYNGHCGLPFKAGRFLAYKDTTADGRGGNYTKAYDYVNGRYRPGRATNFKMLGFERFTTTVESPGYYSVQIFRQDDDFARYPAREEWYNGNHELMRTLESAYDANLATIFNTTWVKINKQTTTQYEAGQYAYTKYNQFTFNDYGQVIQIHDSAENTESVDKYYTYATDTNLWILNRIVEQKQVATNQIFKWEKYIYQNHDKVSEQKYVNTSQNWIDHRFQYDVYGNVISETDPNGNVTQTRYDDVYHSLPVAQINALGQTTTVEYDSLYYHAIRTTDPNHNTKGSEFDAVHRIVKTIYPGSGNYRQLVYVNTGDPNGQYLEIRFNNDSPQGFNYVKHYYDGLMRLYKKAAKGTIINENANASFVDIMTDYEFYDINDDKHTRESNPYLSNKNNPVYKTYAYDSLARFVKITSPEGASETIVYGSNMVTKYDSRGNTEKVQTDSRERDVVRENYEGVNLLSKIAYQISPLKQISIDGDGHALNVVYNTLGKTVEVNDPATGKWQYRYDNNGNTLEKIDPKNQSVFYRYDALNRVVSKTTNLPAPGNQHVDDENENDEPSRETINYQYDDASLQNSIDKLSHVIDETGKTTFGYDEVGNLAQMKKEIGGQTYSFSAKYNTEKKVTQITYPDGTSISNHYTDAGYLRQVRYHDKNDSKPEGHPVTTYLGPNDNAELMRITGNGVRDIVKYDIQSFKPLSVQTIAKDTAGADITVRHLDYSIDLYGNIKSIVNELDASFSEYFQTDGLNRVTSAKGVYGANNYVYSAGGNILQKGNKTLYYNDPMHRQSVTSDSLGNHFQYDQNGNTVREFNNLKCNHEQVNAQESRSENEACHSSEDSQNKQYFYNVENQLIKALGQDGGISEFFYDFNGARTIKRTRDGRSVYYFHFLSNTSPIYEVQNGNEHGFSRSDHIDHDKKHSLQTKYIYGSQSELVAQVSSENVNYAAIYKNSETVNYLMASWGNFHGLTKAALFVTAWQHQGENSGKLYFIFTFGMIAAFLAVFIYMAVVKYKTYFRNYRQYRKNYRHLNPVYYFTLPVLLVVFIWQFGTGCGSFDSATVPPNTTDGDFWSQFAGSIPDDILKVSMPGETEETGQNGGYPVSGAYFFHADHLGSINLVTNVYGRVITELHYLPYGEIDRAHSYGPDILRYKYTHQEEDRESGKYNYNARMYNPESGRFTTADSELPGEGKQSQGFNRYMYAMGNPVRYNDPTGHCPEDWVCAFPGHNFTGPTRRYDDDNFKSPCLTGIDCVSRGHDKAGAMLFNNWGDQVKSQERGSMRVLLSNIVKDVMWIGFGSTAMPTDAYFGAKVGVKWADDFMNKNPDWKNNTILGGLTYLVLAVVGIVWVAAYDAAIWVLGTILFAFNIVTAGLAAVALVFGGFFMDLGDLLSGKKTFGQIWNDFWGNVGDTATDMWNGAVDVWCGWFNC
jgi:RHS repeat-associated protein